MSNEKIDKLTVGSMFAGIGGICLAFKKAGCKLVWANEIDKQACKTYRLNFGSKYLVQSDIKDIAPTSIPKFDILTAGFPCQAFSSVGLKDGFEDPRGNLFFEIVRIAKVVKPRAILLENVANLQKHDNGKTFRIIMESLTALGYHSTYHIMNACEYGNRPQQRNRIFIIAFKYKKDLKQFHFPEKVKLRHDAFYYLDKERQAEKYYMDGHRMWPRMMEYMTDRKRIYRFTDWGLSRGREGICPTLLAAMGSRFERIPFFYDSYSIRLLTPRECARLQGFPETYSFPDINEKHIYKQIGNSVCVPVVKRIAIQMVQALQKKGRDNE